MAMSLMSVKNESYPQWFGATGRTQWPAHGSSSGLTWRDSCEEPDTPHGRHARRLRRNQTVTTTAARPLVAQAQTTTHNIIDTDVHERAELSSLVPYLEPQWRKYITDF